MRSSHTNSLTCVVALQCEADRELTQLAAVHGGRGHQFQPAQLVAHQTELVQALACVQQRGAAITFGQREFGEHEPALHAVVDRGDRARPRQLPHQLLAVGEPAPADLQPGGDHLREPGLVEQVVGREVFGEGQRLLHQRVRHALRPAWRAPRARSARPSSTRCCRASPACAWRLSPSGGPGRTGRRAAPPTRGTSRPRRSSWLTFSLRRTGNASSSILPTSSDMSDHQHGLGVQELHAGEQRRLLGRAEDALRFLVAPQGLDQIPALLVGVGERHDRERVETVQPVLTAEDARAFQIGDQRAHAGEWPRSRSSGDQG